MVWWKWNNFVKNNFILLFLGRIKQNKKKKLLKGGLQRPQPPPWIRLCIAGEITNKLALSQTNWSAMIRLARVLRVNLAWWLRGILGEVPPPVIVKKNFSPSTVGQQLTDRLLTDIFHCKTTLQTWQVLIKRRRKRNRQQTPPPRGRGYSIKFCTGRLRPEVQTLTL